MTIQKTLHWDRATWSFIASATFFHSSFTPSSSTRPIAFIPSVILESSLIAYNIGLWCWLFTFFWLSQVGFRSVRFYWSYRRLHQRCQYVCSISEREGAPVFRISVEEEKEDAIAFECDNCTGYSTFCNFIRLSPCGKKPHFLHGLQVHGCKYLGVSMHWGSPADYPGYSPSTSAGRICSDSTSPRSGGSLNRLVLWL